MNIAAKNKNSRVAFCHGGFIATFPKAWEVSIKYWLPVFLFIWSMSSLGLWWHWLSQMIMEWWFHYQQKTCWFSRIAAPVFKGNYRDQEWRWLGLCWHSLSAKCFCAVVLYECFHPVTENSTHSECHSLYHTTPQLHPASTLK